MHYVDAAVYNLDVYEFMASINLILACKKRLTFSFIFSTSFSSVYCVSQVLAGDQLVNSLIEQSISIFAFLVLLNFFLFVGYSCVIQYSILWLFWNWERVLFVLISQSPFILMTITTNCVKLRSRRSLRFVFLQCCDWSSSDGGYVLYYFQCFARKVTNRIPVCTHL